VISPSLRYSGIGVHRFPVQFRYKVILQDAPQSMTLVSCVSRLPSLRNRQFLVPAETMLLQNDKTVELSDVEDV
jgi:hypothetical protein